MPPPAPRQRSPHTSAQAPCIWHLLWHRGLCRVTMLRVLRWETPLACPDGPDIFMRVLIRERQEGEREAGV